MTMNHRTAANIHQAINLPAVNEHKMREIAFQILDDDDLCDLLGISEGWGPEATNQHQQHVTALTERLLASCEDTLREYAEEHR